MEILSLCNLQIILTLIHLLGEVSTHPGYQVHRTNFRKVLRRVDKIEKPTTDTFLHGSRTKSFSLNLRALR